MSNHTPGPWYLKEYEDSIVVCREWDGRVKPGDTQTYGSYLGAHIAEVKHQGDTAPVVTLRQAKANARLIAAAPDLLAACIEAEWNLKQGAIDPDDLKRIRAAIAKAKGQQ